MSNSNDSKSCLGDCSDEQIPKAWKSESAQQNLLTELSDKDQLSLLRTALQQFHQVHDSLYIDAKDDEDLAKLSRMEDSNVVDFRVHALYFALEERLMTGFAAGVVLQSETEKPFVYDSFSLHLL